jgi:hypothetical protein
VMNELGVEVAELHKTANLLPIVGTSKSATALDSCTSIDTNNLIVDKFVYKESTSTELYG